MKIRELQIKNMQLKTSSGDVTFHKANLEELRIETMSGDIVSRGLFVHDTIKAKTMSGNIRLSLENTNLYVAKTSTLSGNVRTTGNQSVDGVEITANTLSGNITIQNEKTR